MDLMPLSKSGYGTFNWCPWRAWAFKRGGFKQLANIYATNGILTHSLWGKVISGQLTLEQALEQAKNAEVRDLLALAVANNPIPWAKDNFLELYVEADDQSVWNKRVNLGWVCGYMDHAGIDFDLDIPFVLDLKTGRYEADDVFERDLYAWLASRFFGPKRGVKFSRYFCRTGKVQEFLYTEQDLEGPVKNSIIQAVERVRAAEPIPNPGDHCESWYGTPCQFLGKECPLSSDLPAIIDNKTGALEITNRGAAFLEALRNNVIDLDHCSEAYSAVQQLEGAIKIVKDKIKDFSKEAGPFALGDQFWGWQPDYSYQVDKPWVIETAIQSGLTPQQMARMFNISKDSISKLTGKENKEMREYLIEMGVTKAETGERFGRIKS